MRPLPMLRGLSVNRAAGHDDDGLSAVMTLATGQASTDMIRVESWQGREYTVVPVVAIVEGVLQGANAKTPEFAPASEFGKFPKAWDGRPVVMNHPQLNGVFVSAAIPQVLEEFSMGMVFNTALDGKKLKCEAWLDHGRIEEVGGEMLETLQRIQNHEVVDVSVGAWLDVASRSGTHEGKSYSGVWQNVAPDHLAFLSKGTPGACSVADGCGVPRLFSAAAASIGSPASCCDDCAQGKGCTAPATNADASTTDAIHELTLQQHRAAWFTELVDGGSLTVEEPIIQVNKIPSNMDFRDVALLARQGLTDHLGVPKYDMEVAAITRDQVVYMVWGEPGLQAMNYTVSEEGNVKFSGEASPVNLLTRIVPRQVNTPSVNATQENDMSGSPGTNVDAGTGTPAPTPVTPPATPPAPTPPSTTPVPGGITGAEAAPAPTFEALLAAAPAEVRESFESGVRMFQARKKELVTQISTNERNTFTEEQLNAFSVDVLEGLAKLGNVANFSGRPVGDIEQPGVNASSQNNGPKVAAAPTNYLAKQPTAAA
jgi:hypothetical protein